MKTRVLIFLLMLCSISIADNSQEEMEHYDQLFSAINEQRKGLSEAELKSLSDPFLKTKVVNHDGNGTFGDTFDLQAIFNNKAKINGKWYQAKDNVGEYELANIRSKSVTLVNKDDKIDLNLTKGENKNVVIKIK